MNVYHTEKKPFAQQLRVYFAKNVDYKWNISFSKIVRKVVCKHWNGINFRFIRQILNERVDFNKTKFWATKFTMLEGKSKINQIEI